MWVQRAPQCLECTGVGRAVLEGALPRTPLSLRHRVTRRPASWGRGWPGCGWVVQAALGGSGRRVPQANAPQALQPTGRQVGGFRFIELATALGVGGVRAPLLLLLLPVGEHVAQCLVVQVACSIDLCKLQDLVDLRAGRWVSALQEAGKWVLRGAARGDGSPPNLLWAGFCARGSEGGLCRGCPTHTNPQPLRARAHPSQAWGPPARPPPWSSCRPGT